MISGLDQLLASREGASSARAALIGSTSAPPPGHNTADEVDALASIEADTLASVRANFDAGPASAIDAVEELYAAGLPLGLPGGLAMVALHHRSDHSTADEATALLTWRQARR